MKIPWIQHVDKYALQSLAISCNHYSFVSRYQGSPNNEDVCSIIELQCSNVLIGIIRSFCINFLFSVYFGLASRDSRSWAAPAAQPAHQCEIAFPLFIDINRYTKWDCTPIQWWTIVTWILIDRPKCTDQKRTIRFNQIDSRFKIDFIVGFRS